MTINLNLEESNGNCILKVESTDGFVKINQVVIQ